MNELYVGEINGVRGVKWNIPHNYIYLDERKKLFVYYSPLVEMLAASWQLILYRRNQYPEYYEEPSYEISVSLSRKSSNIEGHSFHYKLEMAAEGETFKNSSGSLVFGKSDKRLTKKLDSNISIESLKSEDTVIINLYIFPENSTIQRVISYSDSIKFARSGVDLLSSQTLKLYLEGQDCDLKIRVQTKEFSVHKAILASRSPVLYSMLHHDMAEKNTGIVDIVDFEPEVFHDFLLYLYSGRVKNLSIKSATQLFALSDKYDLEYLNDTCRKYMLCNICVDEFCDVLQWAVRYEDAALLKGSEDFFSKNVKSILVTKQWQELMDHNSTVCNELFIKFVSNLPMVKDN